MSDATVTLKLTGDAAQLEAALKRVQAELLAVGTAGRTAGATAGAGVGAATGATGRVASAAQAGAQALQSMGKAGGSAGSSITSGANAGAKSLQNLVGIADQARKAIYTIFIAGRGLDYLKSISDIADGYTNMASKLRNVTKNEAEMLRVRSALFEVSQRTRSELDATVTLYTRIVRSTGALALGTERTVAITETLNKAFLIGGGTAEESARSVIQLTQAFNLGALRGQDFNSVASQAPVVMEALRASLNKTQGELKAFAAQNGLTTAVVVKAIEDYAPKIAAAFANVDVTIEGGFVRVKNALQQYIGTANEASGAGRSIAASLTSLSENFTAIADGAVRLGQALALIYAGRALGSLVAYVAQKGIAVQMVYAEIEAYRIDTQMLIANDAAILSNTAARTGSIAATLAGLDAKATANTLAAVAAEAELASVVKQQAATASLAKIYNDYIVAANAGIVSTDGLAAAQARLSTIQAESVLLAGKRVAAQNAVNAANLADADISNAAATAEARLALARNQAATASLNVGLRAVEGAAGLAVLGRAGSLVATAFTSIASIGASLFRLIGGWITVVAALAYGLYDFIGATVDLKKGLAGMAAETDANKEKSRNFEAQIISLVTGQRMLTDSVDQQRAALRATAQAELEALEVQKNHYLSIQQVTGSVGLSVAQWAVYALKVKGAKDKIEEFDRAQAAVNFSGFIAGASEAAALMQRIFHPEKEVAKDKDPAFLKAMNAEIKALRDQTAAEEVKKITQRDGTKAGLEAAAAYKLGTTNIGDFNQEMRDTIDLLAKSKDENAAQKEAVKAGTKATKDAVAEERERLAGQKEFAASLRAASLVELDALGVKDKALDILNDYTSAIITENARHEEQIALTDKAKLSTAQLAEEESYHTAVLDAQLAAFQKRTAAYNVSSSGEAKAISTELAHIQSLNDLSAEFDLQNAALSNSSTNYEALSASQKKVYDLTVQMTGANGELTASERAAADAAMARAEINDALKIGSNIANNKTPLVQEIENIEKMKKGVKLLTAELEKATTEKEKLAATDGIKALNKEIKNAGLSVAISFIDLTQEAILGIRSMTEEGSKSYRILTAASNLLAVTKAVVAIINAATNGDGYTAVARMAAVAAAVVPLLSAIGQTIGGVGGGGASSSRQAAEVVQKTQGTGTILGDAEAKSESNQKALDITASATTELIGINRGMLTALQAVQKALGAAGGQIARGAADVQFAQITPDAGFLSSIFGGDQSIIDGGITIAGGALKDMLNKVVVGAYQTVETDGGWFSDDEVNRTVTDVSSKFGKTFQLVLQSIADTVRASATALGILPAEVEAAINAYQIAAFDISLQGLSGEDQQKALEAVFSTIFDGLAGAVVPFIEQFQKVGEGLGETLVRVATEVQVSQEAFRLLGLSVTETDPEKFAQIADGLVVMAGGVDSFIGQFKQFIKAFAPESFQFKTNTDSITTAFAAVGLTLPSTRDGMFELLQSLDATTEAGREQIATILRLGSASDDYYSALEKHGKDLRDAQAYLDSVGVSGGLSEFGQKLLEIDANAKKATDAANLLAEAQGLEGASARQIGEIHRYVAEQVAAAIEVLRNETKDLIKQLYGGSGSSTGRTTNAGSSTVNSINEATKLQKKLYDDQLAALKKIKNFLDDLNYSALSGLSPEEQLRKAQADFQALQVRALAGDPEAMAGLADAAKQYLTLAQGALASGDDYNEIFRSVQAVLQEVLDRGVTVRDPGNQTGGGSDSGSSSTNSPAQVAEINRRELAQQLVVHLRDLATAVNVPIQDLLRTEGVHLDALAHDLGINLNDMSAATVQQIAYLASDLGIPLADLVGQIGTSLPALHDGLVEMTTQLGINLTDLSAATAQQLVDLAATLGTNLQTVSDVLGINLGALNDVTSPIYQALQAQILTLAPEQAAALQPLLDNVVDATNQADANAAIAALQAAIIDTLPASLANSLQPFFPVPNYQNELDQLTKLDDITQALGNTGAIASQVSAVAAILGKVNSNLGAANLAGGIQSYAIGTSYVPKDMRANIHEGEMVVDRATSNLLRNYGIQVKAAPAATNNDDTRMVNMLKQVNDRLEELANRVDANARAVAGAVVGTAEQAKRQRSDLAPKGNVVSRSTR